MFSLPASLTHFDNTDTSQWANLAAAQHWQIDASAMQHFDSSALACLLSLKRQATLAGQMVQLHNPSARLLQLATLYGVQELLH